MSEFDSKSNKYLFIILILYSIIIIVLIFIFVGITKELIITYFGAISIVIANSLKDSLNNIVTGMTLTFTNILEVNDYIEIDKNTRGFVNQINLIHTVIYNENNENISIPNSLIYENKIKIYKYNTKVFFNIKLGIPYKSDYKEIKQQITNILQKYKDRGDILDDSTAANDNITKKEITIDMFDNSMVTINIRICMYIRDRFTIYYTIAEEINKLVINKKIPIEYPQLDLHLKDLPFLYHLNLKGLPK